MSDDDLIIETHGNPSASQRREIALQIEFKRMQILSDHLRALVILMLEAMEDQTVSFTEEQIKTHLGMELESCFSDDRKALTFSIKREKSDEREEENPAAEEE